MPPKSQTTAQAETSFNPEILIRLSSSLKQLNERFTPVTGAVSVTATATRENVLMVSTGQMKALVPLFTEAAQNAERSGYPSFSAPFLRVASSLEKMSAGMKGMVDAPRVAGQLTKTGNVHVGAGAVAFTAGFITLFGANGPDYSGPLSEIHSEIQALRQETQRHFRQLAEGLLTQINGLKSTLSHVMDNQRIILNAVNQVHEGVDHIQQLLSEHARTTEAMQSHLMMRDLIKARGVIERYLDNSSQIRDEAVFRCALDELQGWLLNGLNDPMINGVAHIRDINSESMVEKLNQQSPLNQMGLIAARLRFLFGDDILDAKYTRLPPLEIYQSTVALYLLGTQKSGFYGGNGCQRICEDIQNTLQLYTDFINSVKGNTLLWQALFDLYDMYRDRVGRIIRASDIGGTFTPFTNVMMKSPFQGELISTLNMMEEARLLLSILVSYNHEPILEEVINQVSALESKDIVMQTHDQKWKEMYRNRGSVGSEYDQYRMMLRIGFCNLDHDAWGNLNTHDQQFHKKIVDLMFLNMMQFPVHHEKDKTFAKHSKEKYWHHQHYYRHYLDYDSETGIPNKTVRDKTARVFCRDIVTYLYTYSSILMLFMMMKKEGVHIRFLGEIPVEELSFLNSIGDPSTWLAFEGIHDTVQLDPHNKSTKLLIKMKRNSLLELNKLELAFDYYKQVAQGRLKITNTECSRIDHYCLLFLTVMIGRWDIFENFIKKHALPTDFNFAITLEGGSLTPLMIAAQHGRTDVVEGLLKTNAASSTDKRSFDNKTAAQLAYEQGFYKIALLLNTGLSFEERVNCRMNISDASASAAIASPPNQLVIDLAQMKEDVGNLQKEFQTQARRATRVDAPQVRSSVCAEETDNDQTDGLEIATAEILPNAHWLKPIASEDQKTGRRKLSKSFFKGDRSQQLTQQNKLRGHLLSNGFVMFSDRLDGEECLVVDTIPRDVSRKQGQQRL